MTDDNKKQWYFNTVKKQAELGMVSPIEQRMGPYKTKEDAEHAWDIVVDRNARWEEENRRWKNYGVKPAQARPEDCRSKTDGYGSAVNLKTEPLIRTSQYERFPISGDVQ